jgi:hypothetical protein
MQDVVRHGLDYEVWKFWEMVKDEKALAFFRALKAQQQQHGRVD